MRRVGNPYKRPGKPGWWLRWTDPATGKRVKKNFHNKGQADYYRGVLYQRLNSDVLPGTIDAVLTEAVKEYLDTYDVRGLRPSAKTEARLTFWIDPEAAPSKTSDCDAKRVTPEPAFSRALA